MISTRRFGIEPWIEVLVQNYGQQGKAKFQKGYVLEVVEPPRSYPQKENAVALLLISDGKVSIPAILTKQAWDVIQEMEERGTVSSLKKCTAVLQVYSLEFQCEAEMCKSKFFVTVDKLATVAFGAMYAFVPCCTTLHTVQQKISETWKSLQEENSSTTMYTQSGICLSDFLTAWFEDEMSSLLADFETRLAHLPSSSSPPLPQPSTSWAEPPPGVRSACLPTGWYTDRIRYRAQEAFTVPVSHLYIPAEQMELIQRHPEGRGELEPQDDGTSASPEGRGELEPQDNTSASPVEREERPLPDSGQDGNSLFGSGEQEKGPVNPWDIFAPAVGNLSTSSLEVSLSECSTSDPPPDGQSPSLLLPLDRDRGADRPASLPLATSTQALRLERSTSQELFTSSEHSGGDVPATGKDCPEDIKGPEGHTPKPRPLEVSLPKGDVHSFAGSSTPSLSREISTGSDYQTLPPFQKPRPHNALSCSPVRDGASHSFSDLFMSTTDNPERRPALLTSSPNHGWGNLATPQMCPPPPPICEEEEGIFSREARGARKKQRSAFTEAEEEVEKEKEDAAKVREEAERKDGCAGRAPKRKPSQSSSPPSWLLHTQAAGSSKDRRPCEGGATGAEGGPASATNIRSLITTHPDGTPFSYRYEPTPQVAKALSLFKIPDDLVQWSLRYLLSPDGSKKTS